MRRLDLQGGQSSIDLDCRTDKRAEGSRKTIAAKFFVCRLERSSMPGLYYHIYGGVHETLSQKYYRSDQQYNMHVLLREPRSVTSVCAEAQIRVAPTTR